MKQGNLGIGRRSIQRMNTERTSTTANTIFDPICATGSVLETVKELPLNNRRNRNVRCAVSHSTEHQGDRRRHDWSTRANERPTQKLTCCSPPPDLALSGCDCIHKLLTCVQAWELRAHTGTMRHAAHADIILLSQAKQKCFPSSMLPFIQKCDRRAHMATAGTRIDEHRYAKILILLQNAPGGRREHPFCHL